MYYSSISLFSVFFFLFPFTAFLPSVAASCVPQYQCQHHNTGVTFQADRLGLSPINFAFLPLLNTQSTKGKMSVKQTRSRRVADNYRQAPQKCQYTKVGAVCEMNGDKRQSLRSVVAVRKQACQWLPAFAIWCGDRQHVVGKVKRYLKGLESILHINKRLR